MTGNIFDQIPKNIPEEFIEKIITTSHVSIERIVSYGQTSPPGCWYDQEKHEWVVLLKGAASIRFEEGKRLVTLTEGTYRNIPRTPSIGWNGPRNKRCPFGWRCIIEPGRLAWLSP